MKQASFYNSFGKQHKGKKVVTKLTPCVFPFKYKGKMHNDCLDTGKGPWCPTSLKKRGTVDVWGYCVQDSEKNAANILVNMKKKKSKKGGRRKTKRTKRRVRNRL